MSRPIVGPATRPGATPRRAALHQDPAVPIWRGDSPAAATPAPAPQRSGRSRLHCRGSPYAAVSCSPATHRNDRPGARRSTSWCHCVCANMCSKRTRPPIPLCGAGCMRAIQVQLSFRASFTLRRQSPTCSASTSSPIALDSLASAAAERSRLRPIAKAIALEWSNRFKLCRRSQSAMNTGLLA